MQLHHLIALLPLLSSFTAPVLHNSHPRRRATIRQAANGDLAALKKAELVARCKALRLKVSGTKAVLIDRLQEHDAENAAPPPMARPEASAPEPTMPRAAPSTTPDPQLAETIVDLLVTEILQARRTNETIDPETLASKREALLARGGAAVEEVAARRLAAAPHDTELAGAVALVRGFQRAEFQLRSRDAMREVLRAATLGSAQLDACFEDLAAAGRLDAPFGRYVEDLEAQQKAKPGDGLLDRVLGIVRDRVLAESGASRELKVLARALRCGDAAETRAFLAKEFSTSLDFAARFEAYVGAAADFAEGAEDGSGASLAGVDRVRDVVGELRRAMPV